MKWLINFLPVPIEKLTPTEKKLYVFLENYNKNNFFLSQKELSIKCNASEAAVTRFIQKCNFNNYKSFIIWFNGELVSNQKEYILFGNKKLEKNTIADVITAHKFIFDKNMNYETIKKCENLADDIIDKKRIIVFGVGTSNLISRELSTNINRLGIPSLSPNDLHSLLPLMGNPDKKEIYILFSVDLKNREIIFILKKLIKNSNVYVITSNKLGSIDLGIKFEHVISYTRIHKGNNKVPFSSKNAANTIIDIIFTFLLEKIPKNNLENYERGMNLIEEWNMK